MAVHNRKIKALTIEYLSAAAIAGAVFVISAYPFFRFITYAGKKKTAEKKANKKKWFSLKHTMVNHPRHRFAEEYDKSKAWCEAQAMQDLYIRSKDGLRLHASFLPAPDAKRIVLLSHGYRGTRFGSIAHMTPFMHENGCSILFIDQRCCGESEGEYITFGAKEQYDILLWIKEPEKINKDRLPLYLYGQSMGAAAVILAAGHALPHEVRGIIADSGFHSMKQQLKDIASGWFHIPWIGLLILRMELFCRIFAGFSMKQTDTTQALKDNKLPILFFHGEDDTYVWPDNSRMNYSLCRAPKELVLIPGARHLCSSFAEPEIYKKKLLEFFEKYDVPQA